MAAEIVCQNCGHVNAAGANFCSSCGSELAQPVDEKTDAYAFDPAENDDQGHDRGVDEVPVFLVRRGPKAGSRYAVDAPTITLGRHPDSDIFLDDITVSRRHAELNVAEDTYTVTDVGSLNGTYLNRVRIDRADLQDGDELQIGKFKLVFLRGSGQLKDGQ